MADKKEQYVNVDFNNCRKKTIKVNSNLLEKILKENPTFTPYDEKVGVKNNTFKLPMSKLFVQFPRAIQAVVLASCYGNSKYKETDYDWKNYSRIENGEDGYWDASIRHQIDKEVYGEKDMESELHHIFHDTWNKLAQCELFIKENNIDMKEYSKKYLEILAQKKDLT